MFQTQLEGCLTSVAKFVFTTTSMGRKLCIYNLGKKIQSLFVHSKCKKEILYTEVFGCLFSWGKSSTVVLSKICYSRKMHNVFYRKLEKCRRQHKSIVDSYCIKFIGRLNFHAST